jgi:GNAT superfamily N-acetyltransferase
VGSNPIPRIRDGMDVKIKDAELQDTEFILSGIKDILAIEKCVFDDRVYRERKKLTRDAIKNKQVRIAIKKGKAVGFSWFKTGVLTPFGVGYGKWGRKYCWISFVYVSKESRGQGVGSLLYEDIMKICRRKKIKEMMLDVFTVNKKSAQFHKKKGFKPFLSIYSRKTR